MEKVREARNEGKRVSLYNGRAVIVVFGPHGKTGQQVDNEQKVGKSIIGRKTTRSTWMKMGEDSNSILVCQSP